MKHTLLAALALALVAGAAGAAHYIKRQAPIGVAFADGDNLVMSVWTDPDTGCEYLVSRADHVTPRMAADGRQRCSPVNP